MDTSLVNAGRADPEQPKRFYKFALVDPTDQPFASFRYYYRTWDQLRQLDVYEEYAEGSETSAEMSVTEPQNADKTGSYSTSDSPAEVNEVGRLGYQANLNVDEQSPVSRPPRPLSVPPSVRLSPPKGALCELPMILEKKHMADTGYHPHPAYAVDDWEVRTPSPVKSIRDGIATPPPGKRRGFSASALMDAIASTWKRRGTPTPEHMGDGDGRTWSRNVL